jgi:hypothetical protein
MYVPHLYAQMPSVKPHFSGNSHDFRPKENRAADSRFAELSAAAVSEGQGTWDSAVGH